MPVKPLDSLLAIKVVSLLPDLRPSDRRVATLIIEHYRRRDGRCDPGIERLSNLLGLSSRTVFRSLKRLEAARLIKRIRHGGYSGKNKYVPNWARFAELSIAWNDRLQLAAKSRLANLSPSERHSSHVDPDSSVTQTYKANLHKQTYRDSRGSTGIPATPTVPKTNLVVSVNSADAATAAAERRWTSALHQRFSSMPVTYGDILEAISPDMREAATEAEMNNRGAGLHCILRALKIPASQC
jgi:predicted transcriptional regulator